MVFFNLYLQTLKPQWNQPADAVFFVDTASRLRIYCLWIRRI